MKLAPPRLLPIVIAATAALLLFKGVGLVTEGGYALVGTAPVQAAGGGAPAAEASPLAGIGEVSTGVDMTDLAPTLEDHAVTMELPGEAPDAAHGAGATPEAAAQEPALADAACPPDASGLPQDGPCIPDPGVNAHGDVLPLIKDSATGKMVPLADTLADNSSETAINQRLADRRAELDQREKELEMRLTLIDAAERRIEERSAELKALEERIGRLVDDNKAAEQQQFVSLVAMYENMKPRDAAVIFNELDMPVLLGVTKAMNPRKMAPILARMDPLKAKALTDGIAAADAPVTPVAQAATQDLTNLPQIVGE